MYVTAPTEFIFSCILQTKSWETHSKLGHGYLVMVEYYQETLMNKDQVKGIVEEAKGKVKEAAGVILDDDKLELEGNVQKNVGKAQKGLGDLKEDIKDTI